MTTSLLALYDAGGAVAVVNSASELGMLSVLREAPVTAEQMARRLDLDHRMTRAVLDTLVALDVAGVDEAGRYCATPWCAALGAVRFWDGLADSLRTGKPALLCDQRDGAERIYPDVTGLMAHLGSEKAELVAEHLGGFGVGLRVLEVGAGAASWSLALSRRDATCRITALDLPRVITSTKKHVSAAGRSEAYQFVGADVFTHNFSASSYDLVLVPNVCHLFGPERNVALLTRMRETVRPGGALAIIDILPGDQPPREQALYSLSLKLRTAEGAVHAFEDYQTWLRAANLERVVRTPISEGFSLLTAHRPARDA